MARADLPMMSVATSPNAQIGILQRLLEPIYRTSPFLNEIRSIASEIPEFSLGSSGNKAGFEEAMLQQIGDPFRIAHICFTPRNRFDVLRVDHQ
jgi:hypothetical protein